MPSVGSKKFAYTAKGKKAAKEYAQKTGQSMKTYGYGGTMKKRYMSGGIIQHD